MGEYILRRFVSMLLVLLVVITVTFLLMHSIPGGPFTGEKKLPPEIEKALLAKYKLDRPLYEQYFSYLKNLMKGDFGVSIKYKGLTVSNMISTFFPVSAQLGLYATILIIGIGIPIGIASAIKQGTWMDSLVMFIAIIGVTVPSFVLATILIYFFAITNTWFPTSRWGTLAHAVLPTIALAAYSVAFIARLTRSSMLDVLQQDYIRTARAKGLSRSVVLYKHALKNAIIPIITYLGPTIAGILTGSFVIEKTFAIPGLGRQFVESITNRDYTIILGVTIFYSAILILMVFLVDIAYGFVDPRIKLHD